MRAGKHGLRADTEHDAELLRRIYGKVEELREHPLHSTTHFLHYLYMLTDFCAVEPGISAMKVMV